MGLWNQVKQQASSLGAKAAEKTQELRLQSEINDLKNQIGKKTVCPWCVSLSNVQRKPWRL